MKATLRDGTVVLAKLYMGEAVPLHYSNRTQAQVAAARENGRVIQRGRPFYVALDLPAPCSVLDAGPLYANIGGYDDEYT